MRSICLALACAAGIVGVSGCTNSGQPQISRSDIEAIVEEYILDNPQTLSRSLQRLQESNIAEEITRAAQAGSLPVIGARDAPITMIEFVDYNCGYCRRAAQWVKQAVDAGDVRLIVVELPILDPRTGTSRNAALAAIASGFQNKYDQMHHALLNAGDLAPQAIDAIALGLGLDLDRLHADMQNQQAQAVLAESSRFAEYAGITGTPGFFINGQRVVGFDKPRLDALLAQARS